MMPQAVSLPDELTAKLEQLRRLVRRLTVVRGITLVCLVLIVGGGAGLLIDLLLDLPGSARVAILGLIALVAAATFWRTVVIPSVKHVSDAELAALVEHSCPKLAERLTSTIELNDPELPQEQRGSELMREMLLKQTLRQTAQLDFNQSVQTTRTFRLAVSCAVAIVLALMPLLFAPNAYRLLVSRFVAPWGNFASVGNLIFEVEPGDQVVARGSDVTITAAVKWRLQSLDLPEAVWLNWTNSSGETDRRRMVFDESVERFVTAIPHVFSDFSFHVLSAGSRSEYHTITVVEAPAILAATLDVEPPAYVGLPAKSIDGIVGDISVFERSELTYRLKFNKPIDNAELKWLQPMRIATSEIRDRESRDSSDEKADSRFELSTDGTAASLKLNATVGGRFAIRLTDAHGLGNLEEPRRNLIVSVDQPPQLHIESRSNPRDAGPSDVVNVRVMATDDVGIGALELHFKVFQGEEHIKSIDESMHGTKSLEHQFQIDMASLKLKEGDHLAYRVRTADTRPVPGPQEVWSDWSMLNVRNDAKPPGSDEVAKRQREMKRELRDIREGVHKNREGVTQLQEVAESNLRMQLEFARSHEIPPRTLEQLELAGRLEQLTNRLAQHRLFANLVPRARSIAREELPETSRQLKEAVDAPLPEKNNVLKTSVERLAQTENKLREIEKQFDELAELEIDLLELGRLAKRAQQLAENVDNLDQRSNARPQLGAEQFSPTNGDRLANEFQELVEEQQELSGDLNNLLDRRPEIVDAARKEQLDQLAALAQWAREIAEPQDLLAEALRNEARQATSQSRPFSEQQSQLIEDAERLTADIETRQGQTPIAPLDPTALRNALDELNAGNLQEAMNQQLAAARDLQQLDRELRENDRLPDNPRQAVQELAKRQRKLQTQVAKLPGHVASNASKPSNDRSPAPADTAQKQNSDHRLKELAAQQAALLAALARQQLPADNREQQQHAVQQADEALEQMLKPDSQNAARAAQSAADAFDELVRQLDSDQQQTAEDLERLQQERSNLAKSASRQAAQFADQQSQLHQQTSQLNAQSAANKLAEGASLLRQQQQELLQQMQELPQQIAPLPRHAAIRHAQQADAALENADGVAAVHEQYRAQQALRDVERQAERLAQTPSNHSAQTKSSPNNDSQSSSQQSADSVNQQAAQLAAELAQQQHQLQQQIRQAVQQRQNAISSTPEAQEHQNQAQLTQQAAQLALDVARETGRDSAATQKATESARTSSDGHMHSQSGQFDQASKYAGRAAELAQQAGDELRRAGSQNSELTDRASKLAREQEQLASELNRLSQLPAERRTAQQCNQQQLAEATDSLAASLGESAVRMAAEPLSLNQQGRQAQQAQQTADQARGDMLQSAQQLHQEDSGNASQSAAAAAQALRDAADQADGIVAGSPQPDTPIPGDVAAQVTEAARQLQQAQQQLAQANMPSGQPGEPNAQQSQANQSGQQGQPSGKNQSGQSQSEGKPDGKQGQAENPLAQSAQSLKQAAQSLSEAAGQLQSGNSQDENQRQSDRSADNPSGRKGTGAQVTLDASQLEVELKKLTGRNWGELPGVLRTEILQAARKKSNGDYAKLIKLYFREISKTRSIPPAGQ